MVQSEEGLHVLVSALADAGGWDVVAASGGRRGMETVAPAMTWGP